EMIFVCINLFRHIRVRAFIEQGVRALAVQPKCFEPDTEVATEKVFRIDTAAPGMISAEEFVELAEDTAIVSVFDPGSIAFGPGKGIRAPNAEFPFVVTVPFRARSWSNLFHFLAGVTGSSSEGKGGKDAQNC